MDVSFQISNFAFACVAFSILLSICDLGVGLNWKQRQRQDANGFGCKLHLLTLELINNSLCHNFGDIKWTLQKNLEEIPIIIKIHLMTLHSNIFIFPIKSHI